MYNFIYDPSYQSSLITTSKVVTPTSARATTPVTTTTVKPTTTVLTTVFYCPPCISANGTIYGVNDTWVDNCQLFTCIAVESYSYGPHS